MTTLKLYTNTPRRRAALLASAAALTTLSLVGGLVVSALPAYADVTSGSYTIGSPSSSVSGVTVSPTGVAKSTATNFAITFNSGTALSSSASSWVSVVPSESLANTPTSIALVSTTGGSSCIQSGSNGGAVSATGVTIDLNSGCTIAAGAKVEVEFNAEAPTTPGSFTFGVTTSGSSTPATSNTVTVTSGGPTLSALSYLTGDNTTYTITGASVASLSANQTSLTLNALAVTGGTITFLNSGSGGGGYSVTVTSGGSTSSDMVTNASSLGSIVTLTLSTALADGDSLAITAEGTNPSGTSAVDYIVVEPGNGTTEDTNNTTFGGSVKSVTVTPASPVAGATTTYTISFDATDAVSAGEDIYLIETAGPTNFATLTGVAVTDNTQNWFFVATGVIPSAAGTATVPLTDAIKAGDSITIVLGSVTNPSTAGRVSDFGVYTTSDPVTANAPPYTIGANATPGVTVTVNPSSAGSVATYTIANLRASATITGGLGTLKLVAPSGTVFPNSPSLFGITDSTTSSGTGTVTAALVGGGTGTVTFTTPNTINNGDVLTITVADVINPSTSSSTDTITVVGDVTGLAPTAVTTTTTTTTLPTTTTTRPKPKPKPRPVIEDLTKSADLSKGAVIIVLHCKVLECKGTITLTDVITVVGSSTYSVKAGKSDDVTIGLNDPGLRLVHGAKDETIKVTAKVTVTGGKTVKQKTTLVG